MTKKYRYRPGHTIQDFFATSPPPGFASVWSLSQRTLFAIVREDVDMWRHHLSRTGDGFTAEGSICFETQKHTGICFDSSQESGEVCFTLEPWQHNKPPELRHHQLLDFKLCRQRCSQSSGNESVVSQGTSVRTQPISNIINGHFSPTSFSPTRVDLALWDWDGHYEA